MRIYHQLLHFLYEVFSSQIVIPINPHPLPALPIPHQTSGQDPNAKLSPALSLAIPPPVLKYSEARPSRTPVKMDGEVLDDTCDPSRDESRGQPGTHSQPPSRNPSVG